jgi:hypothetical protein
MTFSENVTSIVDDLDLDKPYDKAIIKHRFLDEISYYEQKRDHTKKYYNGFRFIVTTGSILLPAILSMGQMDPNKLPKHFDMISYWASWTISLLVTASNGFLQLFSLDKNYFSYSMVVEQLKTEGWQFFGLSGKYEDYPNHQSAYKNFSKSVEGIKRKQVEQEFQNGKSENKKKKFDFKGEMERFAKEQSAPIIQNIPQQTITNQPQQGLNNLINQAQTLTNIAGQAQELTNIVNEKKENISNVLEKKEDIEKNLKEVSESSVKEKIVKEKIVEENK